MSNVVETLKQSGHEVSLILKIPKSIKGDKEEKDDQTDEGVVADSSSGSCELLNTTSNQMGESDGQSVDDVDMEGCGGLQSPDGFQGDTDLSHLQNIFKMTKQPSLDLKRTASVPLTDREKAGTVLDTGGDEETDGGSEKSSPLTISSGSHQILHTRTSSAGLPEKQVLG